MNRWILVAGCLLVAALMIFVIGYALARHNLAAQCDRPAAGNFATFSVDGQAYLCARKPS